MTCERTLRIVSPSLDVSGWFATTNYIEGPGVNGGRRFLPSRLPEGVESFDRHDMDDIVLDGNF